MPYAASNIFKGGIESGKSIIMKNQEYLDFLMEYTLGDPDTPPDPKVGDTITSLWRDGSIKKLTEHRKKVYLPDSTPYLFNEAKRIACADFEPTEADWIRVGIDIPMAGFYIDKLEYRMANVCGGRCERKKWAGSIEDADLVIFCAALSEYDQVLLEDRNQNRLKESLSLFEAVVNSDHFAKTSILPFLTKFDLLGQKLVKISS
ncbi:GTP-binding protein alpha subunit, gna, putative [Talaromyces stipitatus ATCC 10500]|uniref:GTP-binding protein alpha subunit, gna, putative n=1 Tax=Talaromyces stipitatus (strain ATCC 10500 / CBS 375.48 / QM 6759 / NRRL 1006) TaxID=441959 RepID=B8LTG1_TALSN|nr:GTP-binding protein alpha subunit, gna, putative [Talaromyces stipitatus ATCC 10500]EED23039.1 GTP-binding protein alpha subunit, gna, putative [Talaromyces stipitatus ATCC 10500]